MALPLINQPDASLLSFILLLIQPFILGTRLVFPSQESIAVSNLAR